MAAGPRNDLFQISAKPGSAYRPASGGAAALPSRRRHHASFDEGGSPTDAGWRRHLASQRLGLGRALLAGGDIGAAAQEASASLDLTRGLTADLLARPIASGAEALAARTWMAARGTPRWPAPIGSSRSTRSRRPPKARPTTVSSTRSPWRSSSLDRQTDAAPVIRSLLEMGYREPTFLRSIAGAGQRLLPNRDDETQRR